MVKRENESDHRLIRYLISLPTGTDITNTEVLKAYAEVLKKINSNIKDSALSHLKINIDDIINDGNGLNSMCKKLQSVLQKLRSIQLEIPTDLASTILSQGVVTASVVIDICDEIEKPSRFEE